jgi:hypothetical protein
MSSSVGVLGDRKKGDRRDRINKTTDAVAKKRSDAIAKKRSDKWLGHSTNNFGPQCDLGEVAEEGLLMSDRSPWRTWRITRKSL